MTEGQDDGTIGQGIHAVKTAGDRGNRIECVSWCPASAPHWAEFRANRVRPSVKMTATFRALDAAMVSDRADSSATGTVGPRSI